MKIWILQSWREARTRRKGRDKSCMHMRSGFISCQIIRVNDRSHSEKLEALRVSWQVRCIGKQMVIPKTNGEPEHSLWRRLSRHSGKQAVLGTHQKLLPESGRNYIWKSVHCPDPWSKQVQDARESILQTSQGHHVPDTSLKQLNTTSSAWSDYWRTEENLPSEWQNRRQRRHLHAGAPGRSSTYAWLPWPGGAERCGCSAGLRSASGPAPRRFLRGNHPPSTRRGTYWGVRETLVVGTQMWYSQHCIRNQEPTRSKILSCQRLGEQFWAISLTFWKKQTWIHLLRSQNHDEDFSSNDRIPQKVFKTRTHLGRNKTKRYTNAL